MAYSGGLEGILTGLTKLTDHPSRMLRPNEPLACKTWRLIGVRSYFYMGSMSFRRTRK